MSNPSVSVIMIVRNGEAYLASAIESVLAQTTPPVEILVIDGHSTDRTGQIVESFPAVRVVNQQSRGIPAAYNEGIEQSVGDFIAFLSYDDLWMPPKLEAQISTMIAHPELLYTTTRANFFLEPGQAVPAGFKARLLDGEHELQVMETLVARRSAFEIVGKFNTALSVAEDVDWFARASDMHIPTACIAEVLLHKRVHASNTSNTPMNSLELLKVLRQTVQRKHAAQDSRQGY